MENGAKNGGRRDWIITEEERAKNGEKTGGAGRKGEREKRE